VPQVRTRFVISAAQRSALARRSRAYQLQTERYCASLLVCGKLRGTLSPVARQFR